MHRIPQILVSTRDDFYIYIPNSLHYAMSEKGYDFVRRRNDNRVALHEIRTPLLCGEDEDEGIDTGSMMILWLSLKFQLPIRKRYEFVMGVIGFLVIIITSHHSNQKTTSFHQHIASHVDICSSARPV